MQKYDMNKFIEFIADLVNEFDIFYDRKINSKYYFLNGGCYELYKVVKYYIPNCQCVIRKDLKHCAILYENEIFDITGKVENKEDYILADIEDFRYMERCFGFHIKELNNENIIVELDKCKIRDIL